MNVRSLPKHIDEIDLYLKSLQFKFSIIGFTETRLNESNEELYTMNSYLSINEYRKSRMGGRCLCLYTMVLSLADVVI